MERDIVLNGVHIGEHSFNPNEILDEIRTRCVEKGFNFVSIRPRGTEEYDQSYYIEWAKYLAENKIYFAFCYAIQHAPGDKKCRLDAETIRKINKIAGKFFLGDIIAEAGSSAACKMQGYFEGGLSPERRRDYEFIKEPRRDMRDAHEAYVSKISEYVNIGKEYNMPNLLSVEATALNKYNIEAGVTLPLVELLCGNPDIIVSSVRGAARARNLPVWGTFAAHEWYGGMRHDDMLKRKRLGLAYKYAYLAGSNIMLVESGDTGIHSYGYDFNESSELCEDYRRVMQDMNEFIKKDDRPKNGPKTAVGFVSGLHDAWGGWGGSSVWNQFGREEWGHGDAEYSWRLLDEIGTKRTWDEVMNYGDNDTSALPAYGMYDIVPIEADAEKLSRYEYLIFLGWNSMTEENADKLVEYVENGGKLLMSAAHLNTATARNGEYVPISEEKIKKLFGCRFTGKRIRTNAGVKFGTISLSEGILYPGTKTKECDPVFSAGYVDYADVELCGGFEAASLSDDFSAPQSPLPAVVENRLGKGTATLVTSLAYPGNPALRPLYRAVMREFVSASARNCDIVVIGSDRLRYSVYENGRIYLLNTDYDLPITVKIIKGEKETVLTLEALELRAVEV